MRRVLTSLAFMAGAFMTNAAHAQITSPVIEYTGSVLGQTGTDNLGVVHTTGAAEHLYRLNGSALLSSTGCAGPSVTFSWGTSSAVVTGTPGTAVIPANTEISLSFVSTGNCSGGYDGFATIEKIG